MHRLTVTLSERRHRALEEASARRGKTMSQLNDESLDAYGIKSSAAAEHLVARARGRSELKQAEALAVAQLHVKAVRGRRAR